MSATIDYYVTLISPFSYLGHKAFLSVAAKHSATIAYKPMNLMDVFKTSGALPIPERPQSRQNYRLIELQRIADVRQMPLTLRPAHFPTNPALANGCVAAIAQAGGDPADFMFAAFQACWVNDEQIADEAVVRRLLAETGHDGDATLAEATSDAILAEMTANTEAAIAAGAVGAPVYVLNGEPFWGQDRIYYLDHALASGRGPYTPA
ncbi:MAG: 2-hydroxychromene-2-carboxylate isomerase [Pseudomonadota bacterium]